MVTCAAYFHETASKVEARGGVVQKNFSRTPVWFGIIRSTPKASTISQGEAMPSNPEKEPSAAEIANRRTEKDLEGFERAFAARDRYIASSSSKSVNQPSSKPQDEK